MTRRRSPLPTIAVALALLSGAACRPEAAPTADVDRGGRAPVAGPRAKAAIYGDATLVPTRRGERAREELALAGAIEEALALDGRLRAIRVDVRLRDGAPPEALIDLALAGGLGDDAEVAAIDARAAAVAQAILGDPAARITLDRVAAPPPAAPPATGGARLPLALLVLALLGLGASAGITVDRLLGRRRRPRSPE
ncbi:MAG: hypothetical protein H6711_06995 [Myxococcales bacterium]|nr:hypothetical protein [Myxococcales bacterium]